MKADTIFLINSFRHRLNRISGTGADGLPEIVRDLELAITSLSDPDLSARATLGRFLGDALRFLGDKDIALGQFHRGRDRLDHSVRVLKETLNMLGPNRQDLAPIQSDLCYTLRVLGEHASGTDLLHKAIAFGREALEYQSRERDPSDWARTMERLADALLCLGEREPEVNNLIEAAALYEQGLSALSPEKDPLGWASIQNSLGNAFAALGERRPGTKDLQKSIQAYYAALTKYDRITFPFKWGMVEHNLGSTLFTLGTRQKNNRNLQKAVCALRSALEVRTSESAPTEKAMTLFSLGCALRELGAREDDQALLRGAQAALEESLVVFERDGASRLSARVQLSLANTLTQLGSLTGDENLLAAAVSRYHLALEMFSREEGAIQWAFVQSGLGNALVKRAKIIGSKQMMHEAVLACRLALSELRVDTTSQVWASTSLALSEALTAVAQYAPDDELLGEAWQSLESGWDVFHREGRVERFDRWRPNRSLDDETLNQYGKHVVAEYKGRQQMFGITYFVLRHFLGGNWVREHLQTRGPLKPPSWSEDPVGHFRVGIDGCALAEMLFNLQSIQGFEDLRLRIIEGDVDAVIGELEAGLFLTIHGETFQYVKPSGIKGRDYDIEIKKEGCSISGEVKVKVPETTITANTIFDSLEQARTQLPRESVSIVFLKIAGDSNDDNLKKIREIFEVAGQRLLRHTKRVSAMILLTRKYYDSETAAGWIPLSAIVSNGSFYVTPVDQATISQRWTSFSILLSNLSE